MVTMNPVRQRPTPLSFSSQLRGPVAPYAPVFLDGWKPETLRPDGQVWEDPVESQHKHEDLQVKREVRNTCASLAPLSAEDDSDASPVEGPNAGRHPCELKSRRLPVHAPVSVCLCVLQQQPPQHVRPATIGSSDET